MCYIKPMPDPAFIPRRLLLAAAAGLPMAAQARSRPAPPPKGGPLPLVMLDPGHGGKDPGAIGVSGTYEKHVAFAAAQELRRQLIAGGRCRVELTRGHDVFIPLQDRVAIAQRGGAALFVSMHADALSDPGVRGASVYTLSDTASDPQTAALARRENSADRFGGPSFQNLPAHRRQHPVQPGAAGDARGLRPDGPPRGPRASARRRPADEPSAARRLHGPARSGHSQRAGRNGLHVKL